jgi:lipopolysaccharide exporter
MKNLGARSLTAVFWGVGGAVARILLQFGTQVTLARILGPDQYGLFAIGAIVVSFSNFFADVGIAYGLIQKKEVNDNDLRFVATWQLLIGTLVTLAIALASQQIASFFGDNRAGDIVKALAVVCLLNALAAPSLNLLKRELDFKRIQFAQVIAYIIGYICVGVPLAMTGLQVWALVIAWLVQSLVTLGILYGYVRHPLKPLFWYVDARSVSQYGVTVLLTNITNWFINNVDRVIVGRVFSSRDVGLYATSYNILYNPTSSLLGILQPVFFAATARASDEKSRISNAYKSLIGCVTLFLLPAFAGVAAVSETFVLALYGSAWQPVGAILMPIALAMPIFLLWGLTTPLLWNGGEAGREFKSQLPLVIIWASVSWFAAKISPAAVAWAVLFLFLLRYAIILRAAIRLLNLDIAALWFAVRGGLFLSVLCAATLACIDNFSKAYGVAALPRLILDIISGVVVVLLSLQFIPGLVGSDVAALIEKVATRSPAFVSKYLRSLSVKSIN